MISSDLVRRIRRLEIRTSHLVDEMLAGQYHSAFKGRGIEFEEVRPYTLADDVRAIDWNVTARAGAPYVKLYREERELCIHLFLDVSGSMDFGSTEQRKRAVAEEVAALLSFAALRNHDKIGLMLWTDRVEHVVRPGRGVRHVLRIMRDVLAWDAEHRRTDLEVVLRTFNAAAKRRTVVFVISDFLTSRYETSLRVTRRRHDVVPVVIRDRCERDLPRCGLLQVTDAETGRPRLLDTFSRSQRRAFRQQAERQQQDRDRLFRQLGIEHIELWTGDEVVAPLRRFLMQRGRRR